MGEKAGTNFTPSLPRDARISRSGYHPRALTFRSLPMSEEKKDKVGLVLVYSTFVGTIAVWLIALYLGNQLLSG